MSIFFSFVHSLLVGTHWQTAPTLFSGICLLTEVLGWISNHPLLICMFWIHHCRSCLEFLFKYFFLGRTLYIWMVLSAVVADNDDWVLLGIPSELLKLKVPTTLSVPKLLFIRLWKYLCIVSDPSIFFLEYVNLSSRSLCSGQEILFLEFS